MDIWNIYTVILLGLIVFSVAEVLFKAKWLVFPAAIFLAFLAGLRGPFVGPDTNTYNLHFLSQVYATSDVGGFEKGYTFIERLFAHHGWPVSAFFMLIALASMLLLAIFLQKYSQVALLSLAYYFARYFLSRDMNQIRQALASIILLFSFKYMFRNEFWKFLLVVIVALQFHTVSLVMIPVYFVYQIYIRLVEQAPLLSTTAYFTVMFAAAYVFSPVLAYVSGVLERGETYITDTSNVGNASSVTMILAFSMLISVLLLVYLYQHKESFDDQARFAVIYLIGTGVLILLRNYPVLAARTYSAVTTIEMIVFIPAIKVLDISKNKLLWFVGSVMFIGIVYYLNVLSGGAVNGYLPYTLN
jgi:hypothetical protein